MSSLRRALDTARSVGAIYLSRNGPLAAAGIAYYSLLSLAPTLLVVVAVASLVVDEDSASELVGAWLAELVGPDAAQTTGALMAAVAGTRGGGMATALGACVLAWSASALLLCVRDGVDQLWGLPQHSGGVLREIARYAVRRTLSLVLVAGTGLLALLSTALHASAAALSQWSGAPGGTWILAAAEGLVSVALITAACTALFLTLPTASVGGRAALRGAVTAAVLFVGGRYVMTAYVIFLAPQSLFGAAGSLVVLLLWLQFSAQALLVGASHAWVVRGAPEGR